jgi:hypothetical protein
LTLAPTLAPNPNPNPNPEQLAPRRDLPCEIAIFPEELRCSSLNLVWEWFLLEVAAAMPPCYPTLSPSPSPIPNPDSNPYPNHDPNPNLTPTRWRGGTAAMLPSPQP